MDFWSWEQTTSGQRKLYNTSLSRHKLKYEMPWLWSAGINHAESFMNDSWLSVWRSHGGSSKAPTSLRMDVLREGGPMVSLGGRRMAICIITQAQCAWAVSGPTRHHLGFGNDNSFLMTGGASREERWTILNENPVDETQETRVLRVGPMALKHGSLWRRLTPPPGAADYACPKGLRGSPKPQAQPELAWHDPWQKPLYTDYSRPLLLNQLMFCSLPDLSGTLEMSGDIHH